MDSPKISVIVPVYKAEAYLHRCVDSLLAQTFTDFEILLIDDGSPDRSGEICDEYERKDDRVRVFHKENGGVSSARKMGLDNAKGEYVCFVDSDDWVEEEMFTTILNSFRSRKKIDILFWGFQCDNSQVQNGKKRRKIKNDLKYIYSDTTESILGSIFLLENKKIFGWTWNKLFRLEIIKSKKIRFDESISLQEDHLFTLNYVRYITDLMVKPYYPYHYRILENSLMSRRRNYVERQKVNELLLQYRLCLVDRLENSIALEYEIHAFECFAIDSFYNLASLFGSRDNLIQRKQETKSLNEFLKCYNCGNKLKIICLRFLTSLPYSLFDCFCYFWFKNRSIL